MEPGLVEALLQRLGQQAHLWPSLEGMSGTEGSCPVASLFPVYRQENGLKQERLMKGLIEQEVFQSFGVAKVMMHTAWGFILNPA